MTQLFVKEATTIDFSYLDENRGLLGETYVVDIAITGDVNNEGMILDFSEVKQTIKQKIDLLVDHKLLVPAKNAHLTYTKSSQHRDSLKLQWSLANDTEITLLSPNEAICTIPTNSINTNSLETFLSAALMKGLPKNIQTLDINLYPETIDGHYYHYSHGLKKHGGNCQRIAHGHRSRIEIYQNKNYSTQLTEQWAGIFKDIYIGQAEDIDPNHKDPTNIKFTYEAIQGRFELSLPKSNVYLMEEDTTIENIARHIHQNLVSKDPNQAYEVHAFEGYKKGAIQT